MGIKTTCIHCTYEWTYTGSKYFATCPSCGLKTPTTKPEGKPATKTEEENRNKERLKRLIRPQTLGPYRYIFQRYSDFSLTCSKPTCDTNLKKENAYHLDYVDGKYMPYCNSCVKPIIENLRNDHG